MAPHPTTRSRSLRRGPARRALSSAVAAVAATAVAAVLAGCGSGGSSGGSPAGSSAGSSSASGASAPAGNFPVKVTAANGSVTVASRPEHIVSLAPTLTEDLYAVGAGKQVVAVDADSDYPAGVPRTSLSGLTPNIEAIVRYRPDLVVASQDSGGLVAGLRKLGVPVLIEPAATTLDGAYAQIQQVGLATGHAGRAARTVAGMKSSIAATVRKAGSGHSDLSYFWELGADPYYSATSKTFAGQIASLFGLRNIADKADKASDGGYPELSQEYIVKSRPRLIFLTDGGPSNGGQSPAGVARRPGWSDVPAVKDNEVVELNADIASRWGPRLPQLVARIAQAVEKASAR